MMSNRHLRLNLSNTERSITTSPLSTDKCLEYSGTQNLLSKKMEGGRKKEEVGGMRVEQRLRESLG